MNFEKAAPPHWDTLGFWGQTVERWRQEGLPEGVDPQAYFGQEGSHCVPIDAGFCHVPFNPAFEHEILVDEGETVVFRDGGGIVKRDRKPEFGTSMSQFLEFPVKERADWEAMKFRLDPDTPGRYPDWTEVCKGLENPTVPVFTLHLWGVWSLRAISSAKRTWPMCITTILL